MLIALGILLIVLCIAFLGGASHCDFWEGFLIAIGVIAFFAGIIGGIVLVLMGVGVI